jgi:hypothetical protein
MARHPTTIIIKDYGITNEELGIYKLSTKDTEDTKEKKTRKGSYRITNEELGIKKLSTTCHSAVKKDTNIHEHTSGS